MHELTIANSLVEMASDYAVRNGAVRVREVNVRLGVLCGIGRSLYFCFEPASRRTMCEGAALRIEEVPLSVQCDRCEGVKVPKALYNFRCPDCGYPTHKVITGREMELVSIELDLAGESPAAPENDRQEMVRSAS